MTRNEDNVVSLSRDDIRFGLRWLLGTVTTATMIIVGAGWRFSVQVTTAIEQGRFERAAMHDRIKVIEDRIERLPSQIYSTAREKRQ